jgi:hypothetical protein
MQVREYTDSLAAEIATALAAEGTHTMKKQRSIRLFAAAVALSAGLSTAAVWPARADNGAPAAGESGSNSAAAPPSSSFAAQAADMQDSPAWLLLVTVVVGALFGSAGAVVFNVREAHR